MFSQYHANKKTNKLILVSLIVDEERKRNKIRRRRPTCRIKEIFKKRQQQGAFNNLVAEIRLSDPAQFRNYHRMSTKQFDDLLRIVGPKLQSEDRFRSDVLSPAEKLSITLRYLAIGDHMISMSYLYRIGKTTVTSVIKETCKEIWLSLNETVMKKPSTNEWLQISEGFLRQWNYPNCIGALDGKHVTIQAPPHSGSTFFNYKGSHSIVLMAACDADYCFTLVDVGAQGRQSDGGIFRTSIMGKLFFEGSMDLPQPKPIVADGPNLLYVIVADEAFQLTNFLMRPFPGRNLDAASTIYNYRHSRARRCIENAFGILVAKWRIYRRSMTTKLETTEFIVLATVCLHNFLKKDERMTQNKYYCPPSFVDREGENGEIIPGEWREGVTPLPSVTSAGSNAHTSSAAAVRNEFKTYFMTTGAIPWQWNRQ